MKLSRELRDFCGFDKVPDDSKFTRFKQDFLTDLQTLFDRLVDLTEPICQQIDKHKASMVLFDTSGIEAWVTENNPKYANRIIKQLKTFLGDAAFDTIEIYKYLLQDTSIEKAYIPLRNKLKIENVDYSVNEAGIPLCPHDPSLPMRREGSKSHLRCGLPTMKFVCPKMKWEYNKKDKTKRRVCHCENPCTDSSCGRMIYIYPEKHFRAYPGTVRNTEEWKSTYKVRTNVEKSINHFKDSFCLAKRRTRNEKTLHADLLLAGIAQLLTVIVADKIHKHQYIRSLKPLIA